VTDRPRGLLVPLTTPFDPASGEVSAVLLRANARSLLSSGVAGLVAGGSTGEGPLLGESEYRSVLSWLRDTVPPDRWLVAGAGRESTRATIAACAVAADEGADAALVRAPCYYSPALTTQALIEHFARVADGSPIPVLLYNIPKYTHVALSDVLVAALADHSNVWGAKDSSGDLKNFASYQQAAPNWSLLVGSGGLFYAALEMGAAGAIAGTGCFAAAVTNEIGTAFNAGDRQRAGAQQERIAPLHQQIVAGLGVAGVKAAMDAVGLAGGPVRAPLRDLDDQERARVAELLAKAGLQPRD